MRSLLLTVCPLKITFLGSDHKLQHTSGLDPLTCQVKWRHVGELVPPQCGWVPGGGAGVVTSGVVPAEVLVEAGDVRVEAVDLLVQGLYRRHAPTRRVIWWPNMEGKSRS